MRRTPPGSDAASFLAKLRGEFPYWGILYDPFHNRWWALRGRRLALRESTGIELRDRLLAATDYGHISGLPDGNSLRFER
jgi:hypothetical protein